MLGRFITRLLDKFMATQLFTYSLYSGDVIPLTLNFYQADGKTPLDLTGIVIGCTVKVNNTSPDSSAVFQQDTAGGTTGVISYVIPGLAPASYWIDVKWWNTAQNNARQTVVGSSQFVVNQSITQRSVPVTTRISLVQAA
jgi:hypothetical protein